MPAAAVTGRLDEARASGRPWRSRPGVWLALLLGALGAVAILTAALPARWWDTVLVVHPEQQTDGSPALVVEIWWHNFWRCSALLLIGAIAHAARAGGSSRGARVLLVVATVVQFRIPLVFGVVGGLDRGWLLAAAAWWLLELAAVALALGAMWSAWATTSRDVAARRLSVGVLAIGVVLLVASVLEVALT